MSVAMNKADQFSKDQCRGRLSLMGEAVGTKDPRCAADLSNESASLQIKALSHLTQGTVSIMNGLARFFVVLSLLPLFTSIGSVHAAAPGATDVVLVMDSSGSMKQTDPNWLRKPAAKLFISLLGKDDRAGVVSFSDLGYPVVFMTPVKGDKNEAALFAGVDKISTRGVYTNLYGAVDTALAVLNKGSKIGNKPMIVVMSDGHMDLGDRAQNAEMSRKLADELIPKLKAQGITLHTIAFTEQSDQTELKQIAEATGGRFQLAPTDKDLHKVYTNLFETAKQPNILPFNGEHFSIDSAVKEITVVGSKDNESVVLSLRTPSGKIITAKDKPANVKWLPSAQFDLITITAPAPGDWQIKASSGDNKAYVITDLQLKTSVEPKSPAIGEGVMIRAWMEDNGKIIDKPSLLAVTSLKLMVHTPEDQTHNLDMEFEPQADPKAPLNGVYASYIALPSNGLHQLTITAKTETFSREQSFGMDVIDPAAGGAAPVATAEHTQMQAEVVAPEPVAPVAAHVEPPPKVAPVTAHDAPAADEHANHEAPAATTAAADQPMIDMPALPNLDSHEASTDAHHEAASTSKPAEKHAKSKDDKTKDEKAAQDKPVEPEGMSSVMKAVIAFVAINGLLFLIGGIVFFIIKKKRNKLSGDAANDEDGGEIERAKAA